MDRYSTRSGLESKPLCALLVTYPPSYLYHPHPLPYYSNFNQHASGRVFQFPGYLVILLNRYMSNPIREHWIVAILSVVALLAVWYFLGFAAFTVACILAVLEISVSADNAVVNSRVLVRLSPRWQKLFLTVGIIVAVFVVRFALPVIIVALATSLDFSGVLAMAVNNPVEYGQRLHEVSPIIDGLGGMFLMLVVIFYFVNKGRKNHWLTVPEKALASIARIPFIRPILAIVIFFLVLLIAPVEHKTSVGVAMLIGAGVYTFLHYTTAILERLSKKGKSSKLQQVGWSAFGLFMYLEVLDASFSLDSVVAAFAITNSIIIIMVGLGIGALWVRSMTLHMVHHDTLIKYRFIESGAHWAIACLSIIMFLKLTGVELPELLIGLIGLVFIIASIISSMRRPR